MTMSTGEVDFDGVFRLSPSGDSSDKDELLFPVISYLVWILFIFFMPVVLINMLVCVCVCMRTCVHAYVYMCACVRTCVRAYVHVCLRTYMCAYVHCKIN